MERVDRSSAQGILAQEMFEAWMREHGNKPKKFPKYIGDKPSIWWIMAGVAFTSAQITDFRAEGFRELWRDAEVELQELKATLRTLSEV
ncbi:hypothetical protein [Saccharothrix sp. HUAS TT1]|uniref:hypothetical protein n=1 Tax=unclassified Saccharothrix TaxID=2593673 RepID=UPI00345C2C0B